MITLIAILDEIKLNEYETYTEYSVEWDDKVYSTNKFLKAMDYIENNNITKYKLTGKKNGKWEVIDNK